MFKKKLVIDEEPKRYSLEASYEIVESYNSLVSNLISMSAQEGYKSIAVTSANYGEEKASVAINLSLAMAQNLLSKRILLVDSDLRRSNVSQYMCPGAKIGLSNYLQTDKDSLSIIKSEISNLDILPAGDVKSNPIGLLRSDKMGELLKNLESQYDYIIIDTAPVNDYADALFIADRVSGFVVAVKKKVSSISKIDIATTRIENSGANILGFVFDE